MKCKCRRKRNSALLVIPLILLCSSCFFSRLLSFKNQLKSFDQYVVLTHNGCTLEFLKPVVRPNDLTNLTGFPPSRIEPHPDGGQEHIYVYTSLSATTGTPCALFFTFQYDSDGLAAFDYPVSMARVLGTNLIVSAAKAVGKSRLIQREYKLDWASQCTNLTAELVPSLADVREVFGPEQSCGNAPLGAVLNYAFRLEPSKTDPRPTNAMLNATFQFDAANDLLRHGEISMGKLKMVVELPPVR